MKGPFVQLNQAISSIRKDRIVAVDKRIDETKTRMLLFPQSLGVFESHLKFLREKREELMGRLGSDVVHIDELQEYAARKSALS